MLDFGIVVLMLVIGFNVILIDRVLLVCINCFSSFNLLIVLILMGIVDMLECVVVDFVVKVVCLGGVGCGFSFGVFMFVDDVWGGGLLIVIVEEDNCVVCVVVVLLYLVVVVV